MQGLKFQVRVGQGSKISLEIPGAQEGELVEVVVLLQDRHQPEERGHSSSSVE